MTLTESVEAWANAHVPTSVIEYFNWPSGGEQVLTALGIYLVILAGLCYVAASASARKSHTLAIIATTLATITFVHVVVYDYGFAVFSTGWNEEEISFGMTPVIMMLIFSGIITTAVMLAAIALGFRKRDN